VPAYVALVVAAVYVISIPAHRAEYRERGGLLKRYWASSLRAAVIAGAEYVVALALLTAPAFAGVRGLL